MNDEREITPLLQVAENDNSQSTSVGNERGERKLTKKERNWKKDEEKGKGKGRGKTIKLKSLILTMKLAAMIQLLYMRQVDGQEFWLSLQKVVSKSPWATMP